MFDLDKLLIDVFNPQAGELVAVVVDEPTDAVKDNDRWAARREMAEDWRAAFAKLGAERGFEVRPVVSFPATGANNADLPAGAVMAGENVDLVETLGTSSLVVAMTEYSATAPLAHIAKSYDDFRAASMPGVEKRMEGTALAADYAQVAARCKAIHKAMEGAQLCDVMFTTGHRCFFDLRQRTAEMDDGFLHRGAKSDPIINLPSGETFIVPYEGEIYGLPSWTAGTIPVVEDDEMVLFHVVANCIQVVEGDGPVAERYGEFFNDDPARSNIAEVAFGVNDMAEVTGCVLEDEKAGFHWAFGRSDHLGGVVGVDDFETPDNVVHQDIVYARGNPIQIERADVVHADGRRVTIIENGDYKV